MREIFIKYNPYRLETTVLIDGKEPRQNSRLNVEDRRLQEWIEELPAILFEECRDRDFKLTFQGTVLDYEDVLSVAQEAQKENIHIAVDHIPAKEVSDKENAINEIFEEIQAGPFEELKQKDVIRAFNLAKSSDFEVNVVATMSAGKSTLINALLGQKLMPAKQEACTATITEIKDNDDKEHYTAQAYDRDDQPIQEYSYSNLTLDNMDTMNKDDRVSKIRIEGNIPFVTSEDVSLVLVDTPGPNNARNLEHKAATYKMLSESSKTLVLYILNATQLAVNDDYNFISHVAESMKVGGKQSRDRFIFVVNKLDEFKKNEDSVKEALDKVDGYLRDNGIENANIYPASALTALNIRTILALSDDEDDDEVYEAKGKVRKFNRNPEMHFEKLAPLTPSVRGRIEEELASARKDGNQNAEALIHCGIVPVEMAIKTYVQKYAKTAKIKNIVDTFSKRLESAKSFETTKQEIRENKEKQEEIRANIQSINRKLKNGEQANKFTAKVNNINYDTEIKTVSQQVIGKAQEKITKQLGAIDDKMQKNEAEQYIGQLVRFTDNLQAEVQANLEQLITDHIYKNAEALLEEYKKKLSELAEDLEIGDVAIDPFALMKGEISVDISSLISTSLKTEKVKVDEVWVENTSKKWYKPWTWFQKSGSWKSVYEDKEYVSATELSEHFFTPVSDDLYEYRDSAVKYAQGQAKKIKEDFVKKFYELDDVLKKKLQDLEECTMEDKDIELKIKESEEKLKWLEKIQIKVNAILDI